MLVGTTFPQALTAVFTAKKRRKKYNKTNFNLNFKMLISSSYGLIINFHQVFRSYLSGFLLLTVAVIIHGKQEGRCFFQVSSLFIDCCA